MERSWLNPQKDRFYRVWIVEDLFGEVVLERQWGSTRTKRHGGKPLFFETMPEAVAALSSLSKRRAKRGYVRVS